MGVAIWTTLPSLSVSTFVSERAWEIAGLKKPVPFLGLPYPVAHVVGGGALNDIARSAGVHRFFDIYILAVAESISTLVAGANLRISQRALRPIERWHGKVH